MAVRIHGTFGSWILPQGASVLGRSSDCAVHIDDPRLSRRHARFDLAGHALTVTDLGSRNGVQVEGRPIDGPRALGHGDVVVCGPAVLMVAIDQTAPHPRRAEGAQDPTTRTAIMRSDTEAMVAQRAPASGGRGVAPQILAAVASTGTGTTPPPALPAPRQSTHHPTAAPDSLTSPLAAVRPGPTSALMPRPGSLAASSSMQAQPLAAAPTGALEPSTAVPPAWPRLRAAAVDAALPLGALAASAGALLAALALVLARSGAGLVDGVPRLAPGAASGAGELFASLLHPAGLAAGLDLAGAAASAPAPRLLLAAAAALAAALAAAGVVWGLVLPTVRHGAPPGHRAASLVVVRAGDGRDPGFARALVRWTLAGLLWPLALIAIAAGCRAPHDLLSGCALRRPRPPA